MSLKMSFLTVFSGTGAEATPLIVSVLITDAVMRFDFLVKTESATNFTW